MKDTKKFYEEPGIEIIELSTGEMLVTSPGFEQEENPTHEIKI